MRKGKQRVELDTRDELRLRWLVRGIHVVFAAWILYWFRMHATELWVAAVDLPGHIAMVERLREQLLHGNLRFYDTWWFSGWPAFQFYAPLSHFLAALVSYPLGLVSQEPARLSVHLMLLALLCTMPTVVHLLGRVILRAMAKERRHQWWRLELPLAVLSCALAFWFLNHDHQWFGIGGAAALYVGLFSQVLAWHLLLMYLALLCASCSEQYRSVRAVAVVFALLFLCHSLTAAFALGVGLLLFALYPERRLEFLQSHVLALLLCGFWLLPFAAFSSSYTGLDIYRPTGDFLELFYRYPLIGVVESLSATLRGAATFLDATPFYLAVCTVFALCSPRVHRSRLYVSLFVVFALGLIASSSGYVASSIPLGLHYYRFYTYLFLLLLVLLLVAPLVVLIDTNRYRLWLSGFALCALAIFGSTVKLPHYERGKINTLRGDAQFREELQVLAYLEREPDVGRVYFAYFSDYHTYPFLSAHFFSSQLPKLNKQETLNGLFIQSSLAYRMPVASATLLGIPGYHIPLLFTDKAEINEDVAIRQLQEVGVTHVVLGRKDLREALKNKALGRIHFVGPYALIRIAKKQPPLVRIVTKPIVCYTDLRGTLPFHLFEMFFYSRGSLYSTFELIELKPGDRIPPNTSAVVINGLPSQQEYRSLFDFAGREIPLIRFEHDDRYTLDHYAVWYQHNVELDAFKAVERTLTQKIRLNSELLGVPRKVLESENDDAVLNLSNANQTMTLTGLKPGHLYRINYSYFPYWTAADGHVFRGMPERIFLLPNDTSARLEYSLWSHPSTFWGYMCSLVGLGLSIRLRAFKTCLGWIGRSGGKR